MVLDSRIEAARQHFNIEKPEDWQAIRPEWVRQIHNVGPVTLDTLRLYLAARGLTLKDDATPSFWQKNLQTAKIGGQVSLVDNAITEAFTICIDSQEKQPWTFQGFKGPDKRPIIQPFIWKTLGPTHGDYSVLGMETDVSIERKSIDDALGTFLSHGERRERWERTLQFLAEIQYGHVVIEGTVANCVSSIQSRGKRSRAALANEFIGSVQSWQGEFCIPFWFLDSRRLAEDWARRLLRRGWRCLAGERTKQIDRDIDAAIEALS